MAALRTTDGEALAVLFQRYYRLVHRVARRILRDGGEAEDVAQEVFLEVYRRAHVYDATKGSVRGWLLQYAYHRTLRRKSALRRRASYGSEPLESVDSRPHRAAALLTVEECRWILRVGLDRLPQSQRTTLKLVHLHGLSLREAAHQLGVSLGAARHYYYRGLAGLRAWALVLNEPPRPRPHGAPPPHRDRSGRSRASNISVRSRAQQPVELMPGKP
jgi:RNA polymerase sigma-70 factor, ECF subfamily